MKSNQRLAHSHIPHFLEAVNRLVSRVNRPVLSGEIALEIGCSLAHVEREMNELISNGLYRQIEPEELISRGMSTLVLAYARVI